MPKFKMKPRVIEAIQWMGDNHYEAMQFVGDITTVLLDTVDGIRTLGVGDYVVKEAGEFIAIDKTDFENNYIRYE